MQKILKWLPPFIATGVAIFIGFFLYSINSNSQIIKIAPLERKNEVAVSESKSVWLDSFSKTQKDDYFYPVNEILIKVDLNEKIVEKTVPTVVVKTTYQLSASLLDPYQLFCLQEELKQHGLKYSLKQDKKNTELLIHSKDKAKLDSLIKVLKNYQISAKIGLI